MAHASDGAPEVPRSRIRVVDSDVHPALQYPGELVEFIPDEWRSRATGRDDSHGSLYWAPHSAMRQDARPESGPPGSDPRLLEAQLFGPAGVHTAILLPQVVSNYSDPVLDAAMKRARNLWLDATWLTKYNRHGRFRGTVAVSINNPALAVAEIDRWRGHPHMVGVHVSHFATAAFGDERFEPIWKAAADAHLPVMMHFGSAGSPPVRSPVGPSAHYMEYHGVGHPTSYAAHLVSLICSGVFERNPELRFVFVEGGFGWVGPLIWRLDRLWKSLRSEVPGVRKPPSEYLYEHIRFTSQPVEDIGQGDRLRDLFELVQAERILLFSTDYPHWDFDDPVRALPRLPEFARKRILHTNAVELFGLVLSEDSAVDAEV